MAGLTLLKWLGTVLCFLSFLSLAQSDACKKDDYKRYITPCDPKTRTRSAVYYLNANCKGGASPPAPVTGIPCDCPPGKGMSGNLTSNKCAPCEIGYYGSGGEIINNWRDWTSNGTIPPKDSDIVTFCETTRDYVKDCRSWKASADNFTIESGDNSITRCMSSVLLIPNREFVMPDSQVSFEYRVDSRDCRSPGYLGCDGLAFFIDNQQMLDYQGNQFQWSIKTYKLTMGRHTLKWVFRKRCFSFTSSFIDKAFIRSITLVGTVEPIVTCKQCPPGFFSNKKNSSSCTPCSYFQYQSKEGQDRCEACPPSTYAMLGASECLPLPICTPDDIIAAPGELSTCSCTPSQNGLQCTTKLHPRYVTVKGLNGTRLLCNPVNSSSLGTVPWQCKCQPGFEIKKDDGKPQCKVCEKGLKSSGVKCEKCSPGHVALAGKHYYIWTNNTLPDGFTAKCSGDCSVKGGWIPSGKVICTARVIGNVHSELQSPKYVVASELAKVVFNCSITCNLTGVAPKPGARGEHLAKIQDCNLIFQVLDINNTVVDQVNCTRPKGGYSYRHDTKRDGQVIAHVYPLKKGNYSFRWVFHQQDESRALSTAFEGKVFFISVLGVPSGEAQNCTACPAGYHSISENTDCTICPNGTASSAGSEKCKACDDGYFAAQEGSEQCLRCGNNTESLQKKDGCTTGGCKFTAAPGVDYDLNKLSRPGGPMIEALLYETKPRGPPPGGRLTIWPYQPSIYVNLCTLDHDNSSCTYRDRATGTKIPRPVMACRSSWYIRDIDLGSVIGYRAKDDVRSGVFVELLHGDKCYNQGKYSRYNILIDLRCDVKAGVGNPGRENKYTNIMRGPCQYRFVWKSLYACPKCRPSDVTKITGECINGTRNITYLRSVPCWGTGEDTDVPTTPGTEECETQTVTVRVPVSGTVAYVVKQSNKVNMALIGVGVVIILALLAVAGFFVYKHRVMKYRYYTLMARNKPMSRLEQEEDEDNFIQEDELAEPYDASIRT